MSTSLMKALAIYERTEANLKKLERLWGEIEKLIPSGYVFGDNSDYETKTSAYKDIFEALPAIDGWKPAITLYEFNEISQARIDASEIGLIEAATSIEESIYEPAKILREYRRRFNKLRRNLTRSAMREHLCAVDDAIATISATHELNNSNQAMTGAEWKTLVELLKKLATLAGASLRTVPRWSDLQRHLGFGLVQDFLDIRALDWPVIRNNLAEPGYDDDEAIPVGVDDLQLIASAKPTGSVTSKLDWQRLSAEDFERLIFSLISDEEGYENPDWLMATNSPDRGRDLSVTRVLVDQLVGTTRLRTIIQCKHWLTRSVAVKDLSELRAQMDLWSPPPVEELIIATSGRFTTDAVQWIEKHNQSGAAPRIRMWPESQLEFLMAARPYLIAAFSLRTSA